MLQEEVAQQVKEAEEDCAAYELALARVEGEEVRPLLAPDFLREQKQAGDKGVSGGAVWSVAGCFSHASFFCV